MMKHIIFMALAATFSLQAQATERISVVGSTTVLPVVSQAAEAHHRLHPDVVITVSGGGSGVGIASIIQGTAQLGMASRETSPEEQSKLDGKVDNIVIASDAVAVVVSKAVYESGIHQLSLEQIADIYRGKVRNWKDLGGVDARILVIDKEASRGTRHVFAKAVLGSAHARAAGASIISGSNNEEQMIVSRSDSAIGMLSNAWLNDKVRGVDIIVNGKSIAPTIDHVLDGSYPIARGLHVLLPHASTQATKDFVRFLLSEQGQKIVQEVGYLPVQ
ncbi:MAG: substrate-binding domain-containing protein [Mariprofundaceae bacterium]|nr:substrate-binding domain-containing protein [Mariprofundaceae bacterium]